MYLDVVRASDQHYPATALSLSTVNAQHNQGAKENRIRKINQPASDFFPEVGKHRRDRKTQDGRH